MPSLELGNTKLIRLCRHSKHSAMRCRICNRPNICASAKFCAQQILVLNMCPLPTSRWGPNTVSDFIQARITQVQAEAACRCRSAFRPPWVCERLCVCMAAGVQVVRWLVEAGCKLEGRVQAIGPWGRCKLFAAATCPLGAHRCQKPRIARFHM